ncbi:hypothetical protein [Pseudoalteromonas sp. BDTF-M6]|uniref:hypothetical protein n=1 Tax=Pseudoalteromonas sp. BDTF-M6 TaxID=2796132 RepID=UPI001BAFA774|nr:hypothetical protein [Pseudoalteromonas sp. BDTF-M6]MBS3796669.1 hypothetical protein [Pseudoalteromonas sp. BDTF-M6]
MQLLPLPKRPKSCTFKLVPNSQTHVNKANNATEVYDHEGAYWEFDIELAHVREQDALQLEGFLASLRGQVGKFLMFDYRREQLDKDFTAFVSGADQDGNILNIAGLPASTTVALTGERIQVNTGENAELKILTQDLVTDGTGAATVVFEPPMRKIPAHNTQIIFKQPVGVFRLADNKQGIDTAQFKRGIVTSWKIRCREAF